MKVHRWSDIKSRAMTAAEIAGSRKVAARAVRKRQPTHPGEILRAHHLEPLGMAVAEVAHRLGVPRKTLSKLINERCAVTPEMALRLARAFDTTPQLWLNLQQAYDLWRAERAPGWREVKAIKLRTAPPGSGASDREVAAYWSAHSVADEWDSLEPVDFSARPAARQIMTLRLDPGATNALRSLAHKRGTNYSSLVRQWISERLRSELGGEFKKARAAGRR